MPGSWLSYVHDLIESPQQLYEADTISLPILQTRKLRLREDKKTWKETQTETCVALGLIFLIPSSISQLPT